MVGQCLDRRVPDMKTLISEVAHWEHRRNTDKARIKGSSASSALGATSGARTRSPPWGSSSRLPREPVDSAVALCSGPLDELEGPGRGSTRQQPNFRRKGERRAAALPGWPGFGPRTISPRGSPLSRHVT